MRYAEAKLVMEALNHYAIDNPGPPGVMLGLFLKLDYQHRGLIKKCGCSERVRNLLLDLGIEVEEGEL